MEESSLHRILFLFFVKNVENGNGGAVSFFVITDEVIE